jgi:hypothetical protein
VGRHHPRVQAAAHSFVWDDRERLASADDEDESLRPVLGLDRHEILAGLGVK